MAFCAEGGEPHTLSPWDGNKCLSSLGKMIGQSQMELKREAGATNHRQHLPSSSYLPGQCDQSILGALRNTYLDLPLCSMKGNFKAKSCPHPRCSDSLAWKFRPVAIIKWQTIGRDCGLRRVWGLVKGSLELSLSLSNAGQRRT